jgi:hypothetical protein
MAHSDGDPLRVVPMKIVPESPPWERGSGPEVVGDELKALKSNSFIEGEATAHQAFTVGGDGEC